MAHPVRKLPFPLEELVHAFDVVREFGSIELYVQGGKVTQITARAIKKIGHDGIKSPKSNSYGTARKGT